MPAAAMKSPATPAARVTKSRRAAVAAGAERVEVILRDPVALSALAQLRQQLGSNRAALEHALTLAIASVK